MKRALIATIFAMALLSVVFTQASRAALTPIKGGLLSVDFAKYEPYPADAGEFVTVWINVNNKGIDPVTNATFFLETKYPFSIPDGNAKRE